jgi:hypothetical protein
VTSLEEVRPDAYPDSILAGLMLASSMPALAANPSDARAEGGLAKALDGRVAGKPVDCIALHDMDSTEIFDHTAILYRTIGGKLYVNRPLGTVVARQRRHPPHRELDIGSVQHRHRSADRSWVAFPDRFRFSRQLPTYDDR